jgi:iron(III) transport system permease protein
MKAAFRAPDRDWLVPAFALALASLLPWYMLQDGISSLKSLGPIFGNQGAAEAGNGWVQALTQKRPWVLIPLLTLLACSACAFIANRVQRGRVMTAIATLGLLLTVAASFSIGAQGWSLKALESLGTLDTGQFGLGWGGSIAVAAIVVMIGTGLARMGYFRGDVFVAVAVAVCVGLLALFIVLPVFKTVVRAFYDEAGNLSFTAMLARLATDRVWGLGCLTGGPRCGVAWNTIFLGLCTAAGTTFLATVLALLAQRSFKRGQKFLRLLALTPIITPPFVVGLGLILLFGRSGLVNQFLEWGFAIEPTRWFYGLPGLLLAQLFAFTPVAFLIMQGVVQGISPTMEEAAQTLRADRWRTFWTVTFPLMKPGLTNAFLVGFIESMADFGNPIILGGSYAVLSTEIFFSIVGAQLDQGKAASLAILLASFALAVFALQRWALGKANYTTVGGKGDAGITTPLPRGLEIGFRSIAYVWLTFTVVVYVFAFMGGFVNNWGRDYTPTLKHLKAAFDLQWGEFGLVWAGTAWNSFWTTVKLAAIAAPITAVLGMVMSYLIARTQFKGKDAFEFASLIAFAVPGTVLGVSYVLAFNVPPLEVTGTAIVIVLCFIFRNLPVGVRAGSAAFKQLDKNLDEASSMLYASTGTTMRKVILPLLKPAVIASLIYSFVRAMTTVSAVIFLVTAEYELATTYIIGRVGNGDYGIALAYCTVLIVMMLLTIGLIQLLVGERKLGRRQ